MSLLNNKRFIALLLALVVALGVLPDPAAATGTEAEIRFAFADTLRMLTNRINIFVSLPLAKLDRLSLQKRLEEIGKTKDAAAPSAA